LRRAVPSAGVPARDPRTRAPVSSSRRARGLSGDEQADRSAYSTPGRAGGETEMREAAEGEGGGLTRVEDAAGYIYQECSHLRPPTRAPSLFSPRSTNPRSRGLHRAIVDFVTRSLHGAPALRSRDREVSRLSMLRFRREKLPPPPFHQSTYGAVRPALLGLEISAEIVSFSIH